MSDLTEFLLARIAEDEVVARAAVKPSGFYIYPAPSWRVASDEPRVPAAEGHVVAGENWIVTGEKTEETDSGPWSQPADIPLEIADHIARHDPARVLLDCQARRHIVQAADEAPWVLRFLALPYAEHPAYRSEWAP